MKKSVLKITVASFMLVAAIWGCKKGESTKITDQPAAVAGTQAQAGKMGKQQADRAGELHNGGLASIKDYLQNVVQKGLGDVTAEEINDRLKSYMQAEGMDLPSSAFDYASIDDTYDPNDTVPENFTANLLAAGKIDVREKFYLDKAVTALVNIGATIDPAAEEDPSVRPDLEFAAKISEIQDLVINDNNLTEASNNKLLMSLSVMKSSGIYWYSADQLMLRSANGKIALSSACKKCLKANWVKIVVKDVGGFLSGFLASLGFWGSLPGAIIASLVACGRICTMCW